MEYKKIVKGTFISRPNRFIAKVLIEGEETTVHVKNTGRCKELLVEGATVYLEDFGENMGSEENGIRPALVIQNDKGNKYSNTVIVASITKKLIKDIFRRIIY